MLVIPGLVPGMTSIGEVAGSNDPTRYIPRRPPYPFKSGRDARNAAFCAAVRTVAVFWRLTLGVGG